MFLFILVGPPMPATLLVMTRRRIAVKIAVMSSPRKEDCEKRLSLWRGEGRVFGTEPASQN